MQKCLNRSDSETRNKNIIILGLPENKIVLEGGELETDIEKIKWILKYTGDNHFNNDDIVNFHMSRLGKSRTGYNRVIKIYLTSEGERNAFLKDVKKLKGAHEPMSKIFVKKDQHPVYAAEDRRMWKEVKNLQKAPGNENKEIKYMGN